MRSSNPKRELKVCADGLQKPWFKVNVREMLLSLVDLLEFVNLPFAFELTSLFILYFLFLWHLSVPQHILLLHSS